MKTLATLLIFLSVSVFAQVPPPTAAYVSPNGGVTWTEAITSSTLGAIPYTPPPSALYCLNTGTNQQVPCPNIGGASIQSSATINAANQQVQADSTVYSANAGLITFGDSITLGFGDCCGSGYVAAMGADYAITPNNQGVGGDKVSDQTWHMFSVLNPGDSGNPIVTSMIGTNDTGAPASYEAIHLAGLAWAALSSTNKILAGASSVTYTGTTAVDTTWSNAHGITCSSGPCTATLTINSGSLGYFYLWYKEVSSGANFSATVDGTTATDTVTGLSTINTTWTIPPNAQAATVGLARYAANNTGSASSHTVVVTLQTGATILGFGFPPTTRYRGVNAPRIIVAGVPPQQNNMNAAAVAIVNGYNLADSKLLVSDGLNAPFVDVNAGLDPVLDFLTPGRFTGTSSGTTLTVSSVVSGPALAVGQAISLPFAGYMLGTITALGTGTGGVGTYSISPSFTYTGTPTDIYTGVQNCIGSTQVGFHPDHCGYEHLAQLFESVINAAPLPPTNPNITGPLVVSQPAATGMSSFHSFVPHFYADTLIGGFQQCSGTLCGTKEYSGPRGFGFGPYIDTSKEIGIGFSTGSPTSESGFAWPIWFTSDGMIHGSGILSSGTKFTTSGCSISSTTGGATAGIFILGANSCTAVLTLGGLTATNGWTCQAHDRTAPIVLIGGESSSTTTTASITIPAGAGATDVISFSCEAF